MREVPASQGATNIYCHIEAAPEPASDGTITSGSFDASETEYSGGSGVIKGFTSSGSFFLYDQPLAVGEDWTIYYNAKVFDVPVDNIGTMTWAFYKRDTDDNDTFLWSTTVTNIGTIYGLTGLTVTTAPTGTVTTTDRLRITVSTGYQPV